MEIIEKARDFVYDFGQKEYSIEELYEEEISYRGMCELTIISKMFTISFYDNPNKLRKIANLKVV